MAATKLQANWAAVSHGGNPITRVDSVSIDPGGTLANYAGDTDHYPTVIAMLMAFPKASVTCSDPATLLGIGIGVAGTFSATHKDAKGAVGGDINYTMINAVTENVPTSGAHAAWGTSTMTMQAFSSDGFTNPLSFTRS